MNEPLASIMRSVVAAMIIAVTLPMIDAYGVAVMYLLHAILIWISYVYVFIPGGKN